MWDRLKILMNYHNSLQTDALNLSYFNITVFVDIALILKVGPTHPMENLRAGVFRGDQR